MKRITLTGTLFAVVMFPSLAWAEERLAVPEVNGPVNDTANLFSPATRDRLEEAVYEFEKRTSNEIGILTISSLKGESIREYSLRVANEWRFGKRGKNNGILILFAADDRKFRIEVGAGLEGYLTNEVCEQIVEKMIPHFQDADFDGAAYVAVESIVSLLNQLSWDFSFKSFVGSWSCDNPSAPINLIVRDTGETSVIVKSVRIDGFSTFDSKETVLEFALNQGSARYHLRPAPEVDQIYYFSSAGEVFACERINR